MRERRGVNIRLPRDKSMSVAYKSKTLGDPKCERSLTHLIADTDSMFFKFSTKFESMLDVAVAIPEWTQ